MVEKSNPDIGKTLDVDGITTNYHERGSGKPLLLIHGSGPGVTAWANWQRNLPVLGRSFHVLAPDMQGFGYTRPPEGAIRDKEVWVRHLAGFLDKLGIDKVSLVGNSFGGAITLAFMIAHPDRVDRAVLMGAAGIDFPITPALDYVWGYTPSLENMREALGYLPADVSRLNDELIQARYEASIRPGAYEPYSATFGTVPRQRHIAMLASREEDIALIPHEVLILHGKMDRVIPPENALRLGALIARSDVQLFGSCGHWVQIERAASFNQAIAAFVRDGFAA